jgi:hypothetical protein
MAGWVKDDLAKGRITQAQADKVFDDLGTPPESREPDAQSDKAKALDAAFPPGKASDYTIRYGGPGEHVEMTKELTAFDQFARTWMSSAGLPRDLENSLVGTIEKVGANNQGYDPRSA